MKCELCGKKKAVYKIMIEGAELDVCEKCAKHGKIISRIESEYDLSLPNHSFKSEIKIETDDDELVADYAKRIQKACSKLGISHHVLAERLNEKESYIERIMHGKIEPDEKTVHKIERELHIRLLESARTNAVKLSNGLGDITLGDVIQFDKK